MNKNKQMHKQIDIENIAKEIVKAINTTNNDYDAAEQVVEKLKEHFKITKNNEQKYKRNIEN